MTCSHDQIFQRKELSLDKFQACLDSPKVPSERLLKQRFGLAAVYKHYEIRPFLELLNLEIDSYGAFESPSLEGQAESLSHLEYRQEFPQ